ncbi:MAG: hypothetical protein GXP03_10910 [Alphaproteobacteria bacterium]|nr:hypothetical protein [Alphaproteobacteria bacterium]
MQIVYHIGAHCTDEGHLQYCLSRNKRFLAEEKIMVPNPGHWRPILRATLETLKGGPADYATQELLLDSILTEDDPQRIIFSNNTFLCGIQRVLHNERLYPDAAEKCRKLFNVFHDQEVEFCLAVRNPATFLPACFNKTGGESFEAYLAQADAMTLRWSEVIGRIRAELPDVPLKVWSNEDTPFIWYELIREITDHGPDTRIVGLDDFLKTIMNEEGLERMESYIKTHPPANEIQRRRILSAFLDKFEIESKTRRSTSKPPAGRRILSIP